MQSPSDVQTHPVPGPENHDELKLGIERSYVPPQCRDFHIVALLELADIPLVHLCRASDVFLRLADGLSNGSQVKPRSERVLRPAADDFGSRHVELGRFFHVRSFGRAHMSPLPVEGLFGWRRPASADDPISVSSFDMKDVEHSDSGRKPEGNKPLGAAGIVIQIDELDRSTAARERVRVNVGPGGVAAWRSSAPRRHSI